MGKGRFVFPCLCGWLVYQDCFLCPNVYTEGTSSTLAPRQKTLLPREYWMIYRGPDFLSAVVWLGSLPTLSSTSIISKHDRRHTGRLRKKDNLLTGEGGRGLARSRIIWPQKAWAFYKSFTILCSHPLPPPPHLCQLIPTPETKNDKFCDIFICVVLYHLWIILVACQIMREPRPIRNWLRKNYSENKIKYTLKKESIGEKNEET